MTHLKVDTTVVEETDAETEEVIEVLKQVVSLDI